MIGIFQNTEFQKFVKKEHPNINLIDKADINFRDLLNKYLKKHNTTTLLLDTEICFKPEERLQDLEGLKLAFKVRTNPKIKFLGAIKLLGFLKKEDMYKNVYSSLINDEHSVYYYRYPDEVNYEEMPPLTEENWLKCADKLDYKFITDFRNFEHGFQNVRINESDNIMDKENEIKAHYNTIKQINSEHIVSSRYSGDFNIILGKFVILTKEFEIRPLAINSKLLSDLKLAIKAFKSKYTESKK